MKKAWSRIQTAKTNAYKGGSTCEEKSGRVQTQWTTLITKIRNVASRPAFHVEGLFFVTNWQVTRPAQCTSAHTKTQIRTDTHPHQSTHTCCATTDSTSSSMRLNSSKHAQAPEAARPLKNLPCVYVCMFVSVCVCVCVCVCVRECICNCRAN
jgi:hypothetical protein